MEGILDVQEPGAVQGLGHIFPQDEHPFPRDVVGERWKAEIADIGVDVFVSAEPAGRITDFAARRQDELLHFGTAVELWSTGLAAWLHDEMLKTFPASVPHVRLRVFAENRRARRFYEKCGWTAAGFTSRSQFAPFPVLIEYVRPRGLARMGR